MVDHEKRVGGSYGKREGHSDAARALMSEKMKAWNRKNGNALTQRGNAKAGFRTRKARSVK